MSSLVMGGGLPKVRETPGSIGGFGISKIWIIRFSNGLIIGASTVCLSVCRAMASSHLFLVTVLLLNLSDIPRSHCLVRSA